METLKCIKTRRSYRKFLQKPIEEEKINILLSAGNYAPSGKNCQSCHFIVIVNEDVRKELIAKVNEVLTNMKQTDEGYEQLANIIKLAKEGKYVFNYDPSLFIIIANKKQNANAMADSACAIENMMLAAQDMQLGSCYINQLKHLQNDQRMNDYLKTIGLQDDEIVCCSLSVGYVEKLNDDVPERNRNKITYIR